MSDQVEVRPGPTVLVGEAGEDWTGDAVFYEYSAAVDPLAVGAIAPVPVRRFPPGLHAGRPSRQVVWDLSADLGLPYPATSPGLLASFLVIGPGHQVDTGPGGTSELYYCLRGRGHSEVARASATASATASARHLRCREPIGSPGPRAT